MDCIEKEIPEIVTASKVAEAKETYEEALNDLEISQTNLRATRDANSKFAMQLGILNGFKESLQLQTESNNELQAQIDSITAQIATLQTRLDTLLAIPEPERTEAQQEEIAELQATIASLEKDRASLQTQLAEGEAYVAELTQNIIDQQQDVDNDIENARQQQESLNELAAQVEQLKLIYDALKITFDLSAQGIQNRIDTNEEINFPNVWETICAYGRTTSTFEELLTQNEKQGAEYLEGLQLYNEIVPRQEVLRTLLNYIQSNYFNYYDDSPGDLGAYYNALPAAQQALFDDVNDFVDSWNGSSNKVVDFIAKFPMFLESRTQFAGSDFFTTKRATRDAYLKSISELQFSQLMGLELLNQISGERGWNSSYIDPQGDPGAYPISTVDANRVKEFFTNWFNSVVIPNRFGQLAQYAFFDTNALTKENILDGSGLVDLPTDLASDITMYTNQYFADAGVQQGLSNMMLNWYAEIAEFTPYWNNPIKEDWNQTVRARNDAHTKAQSEVNLSAPVAVGGCYQQQPDDYEPPICIGGSWNNLDGPDPEDPYPASQEEYVAAMQPFVDDETAKYLNDAAVYQQIINSLARLPEHTDQVSLYLDSYTNMSPLNTDEQEVFDESRNTSKQPFDNPFEACEEGGTSCKFPAQSTTAAKMLQTSRAFKWSLSEIKDEMIDAAVKGECCLQVTRPLKWETVRVLIKEGFQILINFTPSGIGNMITIAWNTAQSPAES